MLNEAEPRLTLALTLVFPAALSTLRPSAEGPAALPPEVNRYEFCEQLSGLRRLCAHLRLQFPENIAARLCVISVSFLVPPSEARVCGRGLRNSPMSSLVRGGGGAFVLGAPLQRLL